MTPLLPEDKMVGIRDAILGGRKIEAIKLYRQATDAELMDAKKAVEALEKELRTTSPEQFTATSSRKGCTGVIVLVCVGVIVALVCFLRR
jgi:ribosomal L7/L12-like protein